MPTPCTPRGSSVHPHGYPHVAPPTSRFFGARGGLRCPNYGHLIPRCRREELFQCTARGRPKNIEPGYANLVDLKRKGGCYGHKWRKLKILVITHKDRKRVNVFLVLAHLCCPGQVKCCQHLANSAAALEKNSCIILIAV